MSRLPLALFAVALLTACPVEQTGVCDAEDRADPWAPGQVAEGEDGLLATTLTEADPDPPGLGENAWTLAVHDAEDAPLAGCTLRAIPWMPDHGHGSSDTSSEPTGAEGTARVEGIDLTMVGYWIVQLDVDCGDPVDRTEYRLCLEG